MRSCKVEFLDGNFSRTFHFDVDAPTERISRSAVEEILRAAERAKNSPIRFPNILAQLTLLNSTRPSRKIKSVLHLLDR
jgi:hypothetical protein